MLQQVKTDVVAKKFDVLLVFLFDRLGRIEDETPFVLEWLVANGVEVWSVNEGQQTIEKRTDKLINYIRFWQSGGESRKTAIRVREAQKQMVEKGIYVGSMPPLGYYFKDTDKFNKHGRRIRELAIHEQDSEIVRAIFRLSSEGYGAVRIRNFLIESGLISVEESSLSLSAINYMLVNPIYNGYVSYDKKGNKKDDWILSKEYNPKLAIIDNATWECSNLKKAERNSKRNQEKKNIVQKEEDFLFRGFLRCKGCGSLLTPQTLRREKELRRQKNKTKVYYFHSYVCGRNSINGCSNDQRHFSVTQCEETILSLICDYINTIKNKSFYKHISNKKTRLSWS